MSAPKNEIIYDKDFSKDVQKLPNEARDKLAFLITILEENPFDPRLHTKPLNAPLRGMFSFRITRDYRVGFQFRTSHLIQLLAADRRDKIYERLRKKA